MEINVAKTAGFCFGVKRASDLIESTLDRPHKEIYTLGDLIHNDDYVSYLASRGVKKIEEHQLSTLASEESLVFIRAHGATKKIYDELGICYDEML